MRLGSAATERSGDEAEVRERSGDEVGVCSHRKVR